MSWLYGQLTASLANLTAIKTTMDLSVLSPELRDLLSNGFIDDQRKTYKKLLRDQAIFKFTVPSKDALVLALSQAAIELPKISFTKLTLHKENGLQSGETKVRATYDIDGTELTPESKTGTADYKLTAAQKTLLITTSANKKVYNGRILVSETPATEPNHGTLVYGQAQPTGLQ